MLALLALSPFHVVLGGIFGFWVAPRAKLNRWFTVIVGAIVLGGPLLLWGIWKAEWFRKKFAS